MNTHDQFEVFIKGKHKLTKKGKKKRIYDHNCKFIILERERKTTLMVIIILFAFLFFQRKENRQDKASHFHKIGSWAR